MPAPQWYFVETFNADGATKALQFFDTQEGAFEFIIEQGYDAEVSSAFRINVGEADFFCVDQGNAHADTMMGAWQLGNRAPLYKSVGLAGAVVLALFVGWFVGM